MNDKKVSFVIPCYNVENYISECLNSILSQSYSNIEIVIVDSSTDTPKKSSRILRSKQAMRRSSIFIKKVKDQRQPGTLGLK